MNKNIKCNSKCFTLLSTNIVILNEALTMISFHSNLLNFNWNLCLFFKKKTASKVLKEIQIVIM